MTRSLLIASAGAGKSRRVVERALEHSSRGKVLLLTFTVNNQLELVRQICRTHTYQPESIVVKGWFSFLLEDLIRPYQQYLVQERIRGIKLDTANPHSLRLPGGKSVAIKGRSEKIDGKWNPLHFVNKEGDAHTFYLAKLAEAIGKASAGRSIRRLAEIYGAVFIDEVQDLVGWDYSIVRAMSNSNIPEIECVGDFRQTVYQTSESTKRPQTSSEKLKAFSEMGFRNEPLAISRRSIQSICDLADRVHASDGCYEPTVSKADPVPLAYADHQGVFAVPEAHVAKYLDTYRPVILRWDRRAQKAICEGRAAFNFGESKGLGFERILILPPEKHAKFLGGDATAFHGDRTDDSRNKLYVGITRARYSVAFLHKGGPLIPGAQLWTGS